MILPGVSGSFLLMVLGQYRAVLEAIKPAEQAQYNDEIQDAIGQVDVWNFDCNNYYRTPSGRIVTQWPHKMSEFKALTAQLHEDAFEAQPLER